MKSIIVPVIIAGALIIGGIMLSRSGVVGRPATDRSPAGNVSIVDGKQIIEIRAKGGYQPRVSVAKSGVPTVLRFDTQNTFDCSSAVRIPSMNITTWLPQSGSTDIDIGTREAGELNGSCGMGMYPFSVEFQ